MELIKYLGLEYPTAISKQKKHYGLFKCGTCPKIMRIQINKDYRSELCKSCMAKKTSLTHGDSKDRLYSIYLGIRARCNNKNQQSYRHYGGKGVKVYESWNNSYDLFKSWAINNGYKDTLSIDRINNDGDYEPSNCRWVTSTVQTRNTRRIQSNNSSGYRGVNKKGKKWQTKICVNRKQIHLGTYPSKIEAAKAYDKYVIDNNLEHTKNFNYES